MKRHVSPDLAQRRRPLSRGSVRALFSATARYFALLRLSILPVVVLMALGTIAHAAQFTLTWSDNSTNETGFRIERSTDGTTFTEIATTGANVVSYVDAGLPNSTTYWYRLCAYNAAGSSGYSNVATGTTPPLSSNNTPTISDIANQSINAGANTGALAFTVGDVETAVGSLTVSGSSSNTTLVPNASIVFAGTGASRTVTVTPAAGQSGTATITVTVNDGTLSASDTFVVTVNAVNTAPTITDITNRTINEDANTGAIAFTIGDAQTAGSSLTVTRSSSNTTLVPTAGVVLGGSGTSRTVTVTPAANQTGTSTITITVSDGSLTATDSFVVTVNAVNDAPTISAIADLSIATDTSTSALAFTVGDVETTAGSLTVSATSSNTVLVPAANVVFGGTGASRTVTVTPVAGQSGSATVTVTVSDGTLTASDAFVLTVAATNTAPTITAIADRTINEDANTGAIAFTIGDAQTAAGSLTLTRSSSNTTLVPTANVVLGGSGASRTVTVTPAANQSGTATITLTVSDGSLTATDSFVVTVSAVNDTPTISAIADRTINQDTSTGSISFTIGDAETSTSSLSLTSSSSNTTLVPSGNIAFGGSAASRTVAISPAAGQTGTATVTITVSDGSLTANRSFVLTVSSTSVAPAITTQPSSTSVVAGNAASFSVVATGTPAPTYQWKFNGADISGATAATYSIASAEAAHAGSYSVVVTNSAGSASSAGATLTITEAVAIVSHPTSQTIAKNTSATLSVGATGSALSYQWFTGASGDTTAPVTGANAATFVTPKLAVSKKYWVRVSSTGQSVPSNDAAITVLDTARTGAGTIKKGNKAIEAIAAPNAATDGTFALMIAQDDTVQFLAIDSTSGLVIDAASVLDSNGAFSVDIVGVGMLSGQVSGTMISGAIAGTDITFTGTMDVVGGSTSSMVGWYEGAILNSSDGEVVLLAGSSGRAFVLTYAQGQVSGGLVAIEAGGEIAAVLPNGRELALNLNGPTGKLTGTTLAAGKSGTVSGMRSGSGVDKRLVNTSVRAQVRQGDALMVAGFVVGGSGTKSVLIRAVGPTLASFGVTGVLADPVVTLYRQGQPAGTAPLAVNDNWSSATNAAAIASMTESVGAFALPAGSKDAVLLVNLPAGAYTAQVSGVNGGTGMAIVEVYDADAVGGAVIIPTQLANISMRGVAGNGSDLVVAGFVVTGNSPKRVLIRAVGPELASFGVSGVAGDPVLTIFQRVSGQEQLLATNNDWGIDAAAVSAAGDHVGAFSLAAGSKSSALVIWLEPGVYTAQASSNNGASGVAIVEVYEVQ